MFGYLRFLLAFLVLISHVDIRFYGLNPGVIAVVIFYLLAGHVVSHLWEDILPEGLAKRVSFYRDRALRILPLYIYVALLTLIFLAVTGYGNPNFSVLRLAGNLLIIPLNYYMVADTTILTQPSWCLIPTAWSLGAELQAYLILPLVLAGKTLKMVLVTLSFMVYMLANMTVINPEYFGYRLIFGVFFIFVAGSSIQKGNSPKRCFIQTFDLFYPWVLWATLLCLGLVFSHQALFSPAYTRETFLGVLIGIPLIRCMGRSQVKLPWNSILGSLSYGVFLSHFLVIWWLDYTGWIDKHSPAYIPAITIGSILVAYSGVTLLERQIDRIRK